MSYAFYGWETATIPPAQPDDFPSIRSPQELYDALRTVWCAETCAPRMRKDWSPENPTLGQCSITAFLVQDIFGGRVYGIPLGDGNYHLYNVAAGRCFDLTSEQFGEKARNLVYETTPSSSGKSISPKPKSGRAMNCCANASGAVWPAVHKQHGKKRVCPRRAALPQHR